MQLTALLALLPLLAVARPTTRGDAWTKECKARISSPDTDIALNQTPRDKLANMGPYSPYLSQESVICRDVPHGWTLEQVQIIARHGARNPTASALTRIETTISAFENVTDVTDAKLKFLESWEYGSNITHDALTDFGRKQAYLMGERYAKEYSDLAGDYFVRTDVTARVVESSEFFLQGFTGAEFSLTADKPSPNVISGGVNNTLDISSCTTYNNLAVDLGDEAADYWTDVFGPPIISRINAALGTNLSETGDAVTDLMSLCSFDSLKGLDWVASPWCDVFTADEFAQNEYYYALSKFYDSAWGTPYGRVQGVGLVNEIIARLNDTAVLLGSGTNSTLDESSATFPLGKTFYIDFSHDNNIAPILPALGLSWETALPAAPALDAIPEHKFVVSSLVPFAGRYIFERLADPKGVKYVRLIINDAVQRLDYAGCGELGIEQGLCTLDAFLAAQSYAQQIPSEWDDICYSASINGTVAL